MFLFHEAHILGKTIYPSIAFGYNSPLSSIMGGGAVIKLFHQKGKVNTCFRVSRPE